MGSPFKCAVVGVGHRQCTPHGLAAVFVYGCAEVGVGVRAMGGTGVGGRGSVFFAVVLWLVWVALVADLVASSAPLGLALVVVGGVA